MENDPLFHHPASTPSLDEQRRMAVQRMYRVKLLHALPVEEIMENPRKVKTWSKIPDAFNQDSNLCFVGLQPIAHVNALFQYDPSLSIKYGLTFNMFSNTIMSLGTGKHYDYIEAIEKGTVSTKQFQRSGKLEKGT